MNCCSFHHSSHNSSHAKMREFGRTNQVRCNLILLGLIVITFLHLWRHRNVKSDDHWISEIYSNAIFKVLKEVSDNDYSSLQTMKECSCKRKFFYPPPEKRVIRLNSTCSDEGSHYESDQKVVSFSLYVKNISDVRPERMQQYTDGVLENLKRINKYYPESSMRLYTDIDLEPRSEYCKLLCENPSFLWCDVRRTPSLGDQSDMFFMTWRFLPLGDPTVDYFLSRDLDSVILERQVAAVHEWMQSNKAFHAMRDKSPEHNAPILGGLWGARNSILGIDNSTTLRNKIVSLAKIPPKRKGQDQDILNEVVFYPMKHSIMAFDSFFCQQWKEFTEVRPFPFKRKDNITDFAGNVDLGRAISSIPKCPVECRPEYGKDWEYC